ncbi:DUF4785 domain-containing protein [Shewanella cyperi]|uniref:DUF4785 domain-containing protein n=1 Tax=Shewanella cyperi TaxID=2814292 RepID=UPI001A94F862|nr:DUF4785 domain-containing protein [Shewanella cyperi]QSX40209.1 DUF4785 family protein [Shewanella cyperi]
MHTMTKLATALALLGLVSACQQERAPQEEQNQTVSKDLQLAPPAQGDLTAEVIAEPNLPGLNASRDKVSFVQPLGQVYVPQHPVLTQQSQSDEYWMNVTGAQLNQGLNLPISQAGAMIRVAARADTSSGALMQAEPVAPQDIELTAPKEKQANRQLIRSLADADALTSAGLDDNSAALQMSALAQPGNYLLRVSKVLVPSANYLVNVKEKNSPYQLTAQAPVMLAQGENQMRLGLSLSGSDSFEVLGATLRDSRGQVTSLSLNHQDDGWQLAMPEMEVSSNAGLSEILVDVTAKVGTTAVRRTVKTVFKPYVASARLTDTVLSLWQDDIPQQLSFNLELKSEGRFTLGAVFTGTNGKGEEIAIFSTQVAAWVTPDNPLLVLPLSPNLIKASGLQAPFHLRELELRDHGQMARLSFQQQALSF